MPNEVAFVSVNIGVTFSILVNTSLVVISETNRDSRLSQKYVLRDIKQNATATGTRTWKTKVLIGRTIAQHMYFKT